METLQTVWLLKAAQLAEQQAIGGDDTPLSTAWYWLADGCRDAAEVGESNRLRELFGTGI